MKRLKPFDYLIIVIILALILVGMFAIFAKNNGMGSKSPVERHGKITFQVYLRGVTFTGKMPIRTGESSFITIRNVPYSKLTVTAVKSNRKKQMIFNPKTGYKAFDDASQEAMFDVIVTLEDEAKITADGAVVGGNKLKIGIPITLEGIDYKLNGVVSDIKL